MGLARALSRRGAPVVAVDADWDLPNLTELAAETRASGTGSATDRGTADPDPITGPDAATTRPNEASTRPNEASTVVEALRNDEPIPLDRSRPTVLGAPKFPRSVDARTILDSLDGVLPDETPVLLDCPAGASPDAAAPLRVADRCLLVTPLRRPALRDAAKTAAIARRLNCPPVGVVAVRTDSVPEPVADLFGCLVVERIPSASPEPLSAPAVTAAYDGLARRLVEEYGAGRWRIA
ncbi:hypothetical protein JCM31271_01540 [Halorubrum trueperi]